MVADCSIPGGIRLRRIQLIDRKNQAEFIRQGIAGIKASKRDGGGIPAEAVIAKLEAKLTAARQSKVSRGK